MLVHLRAVLFDLDGTLLDRHRSFERFVRDQWTRCVAVVYPVAEDDYVRTLIALDREGYGPRRELFSGVVAHLGLPASLAETLRNDLRARFASACVLFPAAIETLHALRAAGLTLGLITNGSVGMQSRKLESLALRPLFDTVLISDAEGVHKPDPEIFRRALARLGVDVAQACYVGNHPDVDVAGAKNAGLTAIWRRDPFFEPPLAADYIIDSVGDLLAELRRN